MNTNERILTEGELEKAWFWIYKMNINREGIAMHFKISVESLNKQLGIKSDPLMEALNILGGTND